MLFNSVGLSYSSLVMIVSSIGVLLTSMHVLLNRLSFFSIPLWGYYFPLRCFSIPFCCIYISLRSYSIPLGCFSVLKWLFSIPLNDFSTHWVIYRSAMLILNSIESLFSSFVFILSCNQILQNFIEFPFISLRCFSFPLRCFSVGFCSFSFLLGGVQIMVIISVLVR